MNKTPDIKTDKYIIKKKKKKNHQTNKKTLKLLRSVSTLNSEVLIYLKYRDEHHL